MNSNASTEKLNGEHSTHVGETSPAGVESAAAASAGPSGDVIQLAYMIDTELMELVCRHNKKLGLEADVLAPVMSGVLNAVSCRDPSVHPFTAGGAHMYDEYTSAWKSLSKRTGVPLLSLGEVTAATSGGAGGGAAVADTGTTSAEPLATGAVPTAQVAPAVVPTGQAALDVLPTAQVAPAVVPTGQATPGVVPPVQAALGVVPTAQAALALPQPTLAQLFGTMEHPPLHVYFQTTLESWLGAEPINLPLLAPGAQPLSLRRLFMEVHDSSGSRRSSGAQRGAGGHKSWPALAQKLLGNEKLADVLEQVYGAYLLPLERRLPPGTRPARAEAWMQEDLRRRIGLAAEGVAASAETVSSRLKASLDALVAYDPHMWQPPPRVQPPDNTTPAPTASLNLPDSANMVAEEAAAAAGTSAAAAVVVTGAAAAGGAAPTYTKVMVSVGAAAVAAASVAAGPAGSAEAAVVAVNVNVSASGVEQPQGRVQQQPFTSELLRALRRAGGTPASLLPLPVVSKSSKRSKSVGRNGRQSSGGKGRAGQKQARGASGEAESAEHATAAGGEPGASADGLTDVKASALLSVAASLREVRAAPPACGAPPRPDLQDHFLRLWRAEHEARAAAAIGAGSGAEKLAGHIGDAGHGQPPEAPQRKRQRVSEQPRASQRPQPVASEQPSSQLFGGLSHRRGESAGPVDSATTQLQVPMGTDAVPGHPGEGHAPRGHQVPGPDKDGTPRAAAERGREPQQRPARDATPPHSSLSRPQPGGPKTKEPVAPMPSSTHARQPSPPRDCRAEPPPPSAAAPDHNFPSSASHVQQPSQEPGAAGPDYSGLSLPPHEGVRSANGDGDGPEGKGRPQSSPPPDQGTGGAGAQQCPEQPGHPSRGGGPWDVQGGGSCAGAVAGSGGADQGPR